MSFKFENRKQMRTLSLFTMNKNEIGSGAIGILAEANHDFL